MTPISLLPPPSGIHVQPARAPGGVETAAGTRAQAADVRGGTQLAEARPNEPRPDIADPEAAHPDPR
eukprot:5419362-Pyramimonas_sp.AAC.1